MPTQEKLSALLVASLVFVSSTARAQQVSGTLTVKGTSAPLTHVYAFWKDQAPFSTDLHLYVFLSDIAMTDGALPRNDDANAKIAELVRNNKIHAASLASSPTKWSTSMVRHSRGVSEWTRILLERRSESMPRST